MAHSSVYDLSVPRSLTGTMQLLLRLASREEYRYWIGGTVPLSKLDRLVCTMADRYPLLLSAHQRSYAAQRGRAVASLILYPIPHGSSATARTGLVQQSVSVEAPNNVPAILTSATSTAAPGTFDPATSVLWFVLTTAGTNGLADPSVHDHAVMQDAWSADGHLTVRDYVLMYATKKAPRTLIDSRSGRARTVLKDTSSWTFKMRRPVVSQVRAQIDEQCGRFLYGAESSPGRAPWGLRGILELQRSRPLFSGVRNDVISLHRHASDIWKPRRHAWLKAHPNLAAAYGKDAGSLRPVSWVMAHQLPTMTLVPVYSDPPRRIRDLLQCMT